ncbi:hypothetical protein ACKWTF_013009 [Chironomus riparius]
MRIAFSQLSVLLIICCVIVSAHKSHKHDKKERDIREFKKVIERRDDDPGSCCCKNASRKWKSQDYEDKMGRYLYETIVDEDYKHKSSKREAKAGKNSDQIVTDKHASKKSYKKVKDIDDEATSVYTADTEIHSDSKDRKSYSSDAKNSSISEAMICLQKCVETLTNWKLF